MSLPSSSAIKVAAAAICPQWPRSAWISGRNGADEAIAASTDSAPVTRAARARRNARSTTDTALVVERHGLVMDAAGGVHLAQSGSGVAIGTIGYVRPCYVPHRHVYGGQ